MNILFVCNGNICRSFAAEMIGKKLLKNHNVRSVGVTISDNKRRSRKIKLVLVHFGYEYNDELSRKISKEDFNWADIIYYMDDNNLKRLKKYFGESNKYKLLSQFIWENKIIDPYKYKDIKVYEKCCKKIERCIKCIK